MWITAGAVALKALASLGMSLLTETFLKDIIILALEKLAASTKTDLDDKLLADMKKAWGMAPAQEEGSK